MSRFEPFTHCVNNGTFHVMEPTSSNAKHPWENGNMYRFPARDRRMLQAIIPDILMIRDPKEIERALQMIERSVTGTPWYGPWVYRLTVRHIYYFPFFMKGKTWKRLTQKERQAVLHQLADHRSSPVRGIFKVLQAMLTGLYYSDSTVCRNIGLPAPEDWAP